MATHRRAFLRQVASCAGISAAAGYLALSPESWPLSLKDATGHRSVPIEKPLILDNAGFTVKNPAQAAWCGIGRRGSETEPDDHTGRVILARRMLERALDAVGGIKHYIKKGDIVLVKPNAAFDRSPALGATSSPWLLEALVHMLLVDCKAQEVRVADYPIESPMDCFQKSGLRAACLAAGGRIYLPDANAFRTLYTPNADLIEKWRFFYRPFTNVDKVIGLAPVKDHNLCNASMGLKNWYGLLGGARNQFHQDIHGIISDLALMIHPTLTILDGTRVLMKNGPTGGNPAHVKRGNVVLAGVDPVGLDAWAYKHLLERKGPPPKYIQMAEDKIAKHAPELGWRVDYTNRIKETA